MDRQGELLTLRRFNSREKNIGNRKFNDRISCICFLSRKRRENKDVDQEIELEHPFVFSDDSTLPEISARGIVFGVSVYIQMWWQRGENSKPQASAFFDCCTESRKDPDSTRAAVHPVMG